MLKSVSQAPPEVFRGLGRPRETRETSGSPKLIDFSIPAARGGAAAGQVPPLVAGMLKLVSQVPRFPEFSRSSKSSSGIPASSGGRPPVAGRLHLSQ